MRKPFLKTALFLLSVVIFFLFIRSIDPKLSPVPIDPNQLQSAITKAMDFLYNNQLPSGEFRTFASNHWSLKINESYNSSPFFSTFAAYSLKFVNDPRTESMISKTLEFLKEEQDAQGLWKYWTLKSKRFIDPDLDDTACASYVLEKNGIKVRSNREIVLRNKDREGLFYTWVGVADKDNDIDCGVNANILLYLGEGTETSSACRYLNVQAKKWPYSCSGFYLDPMAFYYMLSRAFDNGIICLDESKDTVIAKILKSQRPDGSFGNELSSALALCSLFNYRYQGQALDAGVKYLLDSQNTDGSWRRSTFFVDPKTHTYFGSEELTTILALEALARFDSQSNQP